MASPQLYTIGHLFLRLSTGILMLTFHGYGKIKGAISYFMSGSEWKFIQTVESLGFPYPTAFATAAALSESLGALLLAVGLLTRTSAAFLAVTMGVAVYRHATTDLRIELALLYLAISLFFIVSGPNRYSLDWKIGSRKKK